MKFYLISDNIDTLTGLRMAGIDGVVVHTSEEVETALKNACDNSDIGILLITEKLVELVRPIVYDLKLNRSQPLILEVGDRHGKSNVSDSITRYIREAVGIKI